jgi:uncharacterized protein YecE (DUF72 family)
MAQLYLGLSGYSYKPWQGEGRFYPPELKQKDFLRYYCEHYPAVEMDGTWYRMPSESAVQVWLNGSPDSFRYTFKAHRDITHIGRLKADKLPSLKFMVERLEPLKKAGKLAAVFMQLPPNFKKNEDRLGWDTDEVAGQRRDTGAFLYTRMRREAYTDEQLADWAAWFQAGIDRGKDCYVFFKHEDEGSPWIDAERLRKIMGA